MKEEKIDMIKLTEELLGQAGGRMGDAESIYQSIMELHDATGLFARDLHDGNAMRRPDGDIVIVDVGMFKTAAELQQMKREGFEKTGSESK